MNKNAKSVLQELIQAQHLKIPEYLTVRTGGPDHNPEFNCKITVGSLILNVAGASKSLAETAAAQKVLDVLAGKSPPAKLAKSFELPEIPKVRTRPR